MKLRKEMVLLILGGAMSLASPAMAQQDGASLFQARGCVACHGTNGSTALLPTYPKLAGQNEQYLLNQMKDIKSGARNNGQTGLMKPVVANVSDADFAAIAKWLSGQKPK